MSEAKFKTIPLRDVFREPIDLDAHPDGLLLRLCACLGRMRTAIEDLEAAIARTPALTIDGRKMKAMSL
jgi:hypothetical protein